MNFKCLKLKNTKTNFDNFMKGIYQLVQIFDWVKILPTGIIHNLNNFARGAAGKELKTTMDSDRSSFRLNLFGKISEIDENEVICSVMDIKNDFFDENT